MYVKNIISIYVKILQIFEGKGKVIPVQAVEILWVARG
jgi:hypothetical protein